MSAPMRFALVGSGRQLIACGQQILARGHELSAIHSTCVEVAAWAARIGMPVRGLGAGDWAWPASIDYLISVVNHTLLPRNVIEAPRYGAINFHDSLLPRYAGFNATAWAILDRQTTHGITWHVMTGEADRGDILLQRTVEVSDDDTAFTLSVKCSEAGVAAFAQLLDRIEQGQLAGTPQSGKGSFHLRSDRPGLALLDSSRPATESAALVRALEFASEDNWMARPKLSVHDRYVIVTGARVEAERRPAAQVSAVDDDGIVVGSSDSALRLSGFMSPDGDTITPQEAASRLGIRVGSPLPPVGDAAQQAATFDAGITKAERFWVNRLASIQPAGIEGAHNHDGPVNPRVIDRTLPRQFRDMDASRREAFMLAAITAYLRRVSRENGADIAVEAVVPELLRPFYATVVPCRVPRTDDQPFHDYVAAARRELEIVRNRGTYARDAVTRYARLRARPASSHRLPIGARLNGSIPRAPHEALVAGTYATFHLGAESYAIAFDEAAVPSWLATEFADGFHALLYAASADAAASVDSLPIMPSEKRQLLLDDWQRTGRPYDPTVCVHQHFERQAAAHAGAPAITFDGRTWSYEELNARSNAAAHALRAAGVERGALVGLCVERSLEMVAGMLGILKAGAAYVPLDPAYPADRLSMMLEDSGARVVLSRPDLLPEVPASCEVVLPIDDVLSRSRLEDTPATGVSGDDLAYVIFTSGSTGRPKGTMVTHRNVANFFAGMDDVVGAEKPGVWLAVTSISFDISVLELLWTLGRGFHVIIAPESDRASMVRRANRAQAPSMEFGLFYFAADSGAAVSGDAYRLLLEGAKFADENGFASVWTPERHFHAFGGLYPNPAVTTAALSTITKRVALRAGSVVLPLHNPLRVAEDWAVIDQLSGGRVGLSFASGWHVNDFALMPESYDRRREIMLEHIETVLKLWRGERVKVVNGAGKEIDVAVLPRPVQERPPIWIASAGSVETFQLAGRLGANVLTNMLGQDLDDLKTKFAAYRAARKAHGHAGDGTISVMLHTFIAETDEEARRLARKPFSDYLATSFDLVKVAPKMFPAFRQPSRKDGAGTIDADAFTAEDMEALMSHAFERYYETAGLFGTPERALEMVDRLAAIGATEIACLIDFGIDPEAVLESLPHLNRLRRLAANRTVAAGHPGLTDLAHEYGVTHMQCTPSMARALLADAGAAKALGTFEKLLVGGEAIPEDLAQQLVSTVQGAVLNMYGPTETTVWSTVSKLTRGNGVTIGRPIANTTIRILDEHLQLVPIGTPGELFIGGDGVVRGYLNQPDLTAQRFIPDPWGNGRLYRTGDLARYRQDGQIEFLGRLDHQVKINGYRVELGEIESALARHPAVRQSVVVARTDGETKAQRLVAYVEASTNSANPNADAAAVADWETLWSETYRSGRTDDPRFRIAGWNDSYSGAPIPTAQMEEWLEATVARVRELSPKRVVEIGCGTGMILYRLLPHVEHYVGLDVSADALQSIRNELTPAEAAKTTLLHQAADAMTGIPDRSCDLVIINSVAQYFPSAGYFEHVLRRAADLVRDGGTIFVGDVRSLDHLDAFHSSIELHQSSGMLGSAQLRSRIARRVETERELVVSESFFEEIAARTDRISRVDFALKRGRHENELTRYRYDAFLRIGTQGRQLRKPGLVTSTLDGLRGALTDGADTILLVDALNARLADWRRTQQALQGETIDVDALKRAPSTEGIDPEALHVMDPSYAVSVRWAASGDPTRLDALFTRKPIDPAGVEWPARPENRRARTNVPYRGGDSGSLVPQLREHLRRTLPEFMIPATFVVLDALPLTPNGKIDRKALPDPATKAKAPATEYAAPATDLERVIADVWCELLAVERVSRQVSIFDLGANSLLTMQANNRLSSMLGRRVSLVSMFKFPTVASLAAHLAGDDASASNGKKSQDRAARAEQAASRRRALRAERKDK